MKIDRRGFFIMSSATAAGVRTPAYVASVETLDIVGSGVAALSVEDHANNRRIAKEIVAQILRGEVSLPPRRVANPDTTPWRVVRAKQ